MSATHGFYTDTHAVAHNFYQYTKSRRTCAHSYCHEIRRIVGMLNDPEGHVEYMGCGHNDLEYQIFYAENHDWADTEEYAPIMGQEFDHLHIFMHGTYSQLQEYLTSEAWKPHYADSENFSLEYAVAELLAIRSNDQRLHRHIISDAWLDLQDAVDCISFLDKEAAA